ncbi:MAG TPA: metallopeptidase TldD-related protein [Candidatus Sulfotelmatobacter sp.]|nr:metallopeptidase TldD-related protein [Candidatus Sulfotelmatobacter sp.]
MPASHLCRRGCGLALAVALSIFSAGAQQKPAKAKSAAAGSKTSDPILKAMREELERSKSQLKMENMAAPYYLEYRLSDAEEYTAEAAFGGLRQSQRTHVRTVRVVVRVGDYKLDSYYGPGMGIVDLAPLEDNDIAIRHALWLATDRAYKTATEALAAKKAVLSQFTADQPFDDFAPAPAVESIAPLARLDFEEKPWDEALVKATNLFRTDPQIQSLTATLRFRAINQYFVNSEGSVTRGGFAAYFLMVSGSTQAADGMQLERSPYFSAANLRELPGEEKFLAETRKMLDTLKGLRDAPVVDEEYRGPVLFSPDASTDIFNGMIGGNVLGRRPKPGESARTEGAFASSYKSRVLPAFLSVVDDPTLKTMNGTTLIGSYEYDDEGVRAEKVPVIQDGELENYLIGREPIRDVPKSNGHGRGTQGMPPAPSIGNLLVEPKQPLSPEDLKKKLIEICRQEGKSYGYRVETLAGYNPRLLYRVYEKDGHEELVRGAVFNELDARALRNDLIAAGNDPLVSNREGQTPTTVVAPSILFDELEVKRTDAKNAKLPEYPAPELAPAH